MYYILVCKTNRNLRTIYVPTLLPTYAHIKNTSLKSIKNIYSKLEFYQKYVLEYNQDNNFNIYMIKYLEIFISKYVIN